MSFSTLIDMTDVKEFLRRATAEEKAELRALLELEIPATKHVLLTERVLEEKTTVVVPSTPAAIGGGTPKKTEMPVPSLPVGMDKPDASAYRLRPEQIVDGVCVGRRIPHGDKRWSIEILAESQCGGVCVDGSDLCKACLRRETTYLAEPKPGSWHGRITEEPPDWLHMLGTAWAESRLASGKLEWMPTYLTAAGGAGDAESVASSSSSVFEMRLARKAAIEAAKAAEKEAAKIARETEREAKRAAKGAEKAVKLALRAIEREAKQEAKKANEAEKEAKRAAKEAAKKEKEAAKSL